MAIKLPQGFEITSKNPIDSRLVLSKEEMAGVVAAKMPDVYFAICKDDCKLYVYNKNNEVDPETGRFRVLADDEKKNAYQSISKLQDYLYEVHYDELDYNYANEWFKTSNDDSFRGACSSVRNGNWYGRNFDWTYDYCADFIIKTPRTAGRFATIGLGGNEDALTDEFVESGAYNELYKIVPFKLLDGENEYGVFANTNVAPAQFEKTTGTTPRVSKKYEMCSLMLPRFILDNFKTAKEAVDYIQDYVSVYCYDHLYNNYKEDIHVMVGDKNETYIIEFINNETVAKKYDKPIMTNFVVNNIIFNEDGSVYTPTDRFSDASKDPISVNKISSHGAGLERFNLINESYDLLTSKENVRELMTALRYTNTYKNSDPAWYSECVGEYDGGDLRLDSSKESFDMALDVMKELYASRSRNTGKTWQTVHSCVYDLDKSKVYLIVQENEIELNFNFDYYTAQQVDLLIADADISSDKLASKIPDALRKALENQQSKSGLVVDSTGNIKVNLGDTFTIDDANKIELDVEMIQAI